MWHELQVSPLISQNWHENVNSEKKLSIRIITEQKFILKCSQSHTTHVSTAGVEATGLPLRAGTPARSGGRGTVLFERLLFVFNMIFPAYEMKLYDIKNNLQVKPYLIIQPSLLHSFVWFILSEKENVKQSMPSSSNLVYLVMIKLVILPANTIIIFIKWLRKQICLYLYAYYWNTQFQVFNMEMAIYHI